MSALFRNAQRPLEIPPDEDPVKGQLMHPSVVDFWLQHRKRRWLGHRFWAAFSPFPSGDNKLENPCLYFSNDGKTWLEAAGNPLTANAEGSDGQTWDDNGAPAGGGYNNDPELIYDRASDSLMLYFGGSFGSSAAETLLKWYRISIRGPNSTLVISSPELVYADSSSDLILSPAVVRVSKYDWHAWYCSKRASSGIAALNIWHLRSKNGIFSDCSPEICTNPLPSSWYPWHLEVRRFGHKFWFLIVATKSITAFDGSSNLRFATSTNGRRLIDYSEKQWAVSPSEVPLSWDEAVYRATFVIGEFGATTIWYSGYRKVGRTDVWRTGRTEGRLRTS